MVEQRRQKPTSSVSREDLNAFSSQKDGVCSEFVESITNTDCICCLLKGE